MADAAGKTKKESSERVISRFFDLAASKINLDKSIWMLMKVPFREINVQMPMEMDDGRLEIFAGYRIQHSQARGPMKGGIRYHPSVDLDEVRALAAVMTSLTFVGTMAFGWHYAVDAFGGIALAWVVCALLWRYLPRWHERAEAS